MSDCFRYHPYGCHLCWGIHTRVCETCKKISVRSLAHTLLNKARVPEELRCFLQTHEHVNAFLCAADNLRPEWIDQLIKFAHELLAPFDFELMVGGWAKTHPDRFAIATDLLVSGD